MAYNNATGQFVGGQVNVIGNLDYTATNSGTIANTITGTGNFNKDGAEKLTITGNASGFTGATNINAGTLAYSNNVGKFVGGKVDIAQDGTLLYTAVVEAAINNTITGNGTLDKQGSAVLNLNNDNSGFNGNVDINEGTLAYDTSKGGKFFGTGSSYEISDGAALDITTNSDSETVNIQNVSSEGSLNTAAINKNGKGVLELAGQNVDYKGVLNVNDGNVKYENTSSNSYIGGTTNIEPNGVLDYIATTTGSLSDVTGSGTLNKSGAEALVFNETDNTFTGTANINAGTLTVGGADGATSLAFNTVINNGTFDYTAGIGSDIIIGGSGSKVAFAEGATGEAIFNGLGAANTNFKLDEMVKLTDNTTVTINNANVQLLNDSYLDGKYQIKDVTLDLRDDNYNSETTFKNLDIAGNAKIKIDVDLQPLSGIPQSDILNVENGTGVLNIALSEISLHNEKNNGDDGLKDSYEFDVIKGSSNLTLSREDSIQKWATNVYEYDVDVKSDAKGIVLNKNKAADENSLKSMNEFEGNRGFEFTTNDDRPYVTGSNLGETAEGSFVVNGTSDGKTIISGNGTNSMFEVVNDTDLSVNDVTITQANGSNGSVVKADNDSANVGLNNVNMTNNSSTGDGGAINNINSESMTVSNSTLSGNTAGGNGGAINNTSGGTTIIDNVTAYNNTSDGLGGAIYTNKDMTIKDSDFGVDENGNLSVNTDSNGQNDIYIDNATVTLDSSTKDTTINSGLAGDGIVNKTGSKDLNLSGTNENFTGDFNVQNGNVNFTQNNAGDSYVSGNTSISDSSTITLNNDLSDITAGNFSGDGKLVKDGSKNVILTGDNSSMAGDVTVNNGSIVYNPDNGTKYFGGKTILNGSGSNDGSLVVNTNNGASISKIEGDGTIVKTGSGALTLSGDNSGFTGDLNINGGSLAFDAGALIGNLNNAVFAGDTSINLQNTTVVNNGSGSYSTNPNPSSIESLSFKNITLNGNVKLNIDVDLKNTVADNISAESVSGSGKFVLGSGSLNVVSDSLLHNTKVKIASGALASGDWISLDSSAQTVMGPIQRYFVDYSGGDLSFTRAGSYRPSINDVNPAVMASSVASQIGGYLTQVQTLHDGFFHLERYMKYSSSQRKSAEMNNQYAINTVAPVYSNANLPEVSSAMWVKPYTTFEKVNLKGGLGVSNVAYGSLYGGDSNMYDLGHGYKGILSAFVAYNGSHQAYNGVDINQQGGAIGLTGTLYKGNFFSAITASAGASVADANTQYGSEDFALMTAGIANKTGYNLEFKDGKIIVQPSLFVGYTFVNTFDYTSASGVRMENDPLHTIQVAPSLKVVGNLDNGWQPYASIDMIWNIMGRTNVTAYDVQLPQLSVKPYVQYGVGLQKTWGDRFTGFFQTMIRNGGRNGIVLQGGFRWAIGKNYENKEQVKLDSPVIDSSVSSKNTTKTNNVSNSTNVKTSTNIWTKFVNKMDGSTNFEQTTDAGKKIIKSNAKKVNNTTITSMKGHIDKI